MTNLTKKLDATTQTKFTAKEAAEIAGVDTYTILHSIHRGKLLGEKRGPGRTAPYFIWRASLRSYLEKREKRLAKSAAKTAQAS